MLIKRVRKIALILTFVIAVPLFFFHINWGLGFILGGLVSILGFEMIKRTTMKASLDKLKSSLRNSRILRMVIYASALTISLLFPLVFNIFSLFFGLFVIKLAIVVNQYFMKGFDSDEHFDV